nr:MAG TPA: hypothetical protein [Caudoviricetes sp.]
MPARRVPRSRAGAPAFTPGGPGSPLDRGLTRRVLMGQGASKERKVSPIPPLKREIYNN